MSRSKNMRTGRRGFAIMLVMGTMIFMGMAIVAMSVLFAHEARRTRSVVAAGQMRQMLLAAVPCAAAELSARGNTTREIAIPTPVEGASLALHVAPGESGEGSALVMARAGYRGYRAEQSIKFVRTADGSWKLVDAKLTRTGME